MKSIFTLFSLMIAFVLSAEENAHPAAAYVLARDAAGAPAVCLHANWQQVSSGIPPQLLPQTKLLEQRNKFVAQGNFDAATALYKSGDSRTIAREDFTPPESAKKFASENFLFFDSITQCDDITVIYFGIGKSAKESIPWFEVVRKIKHDNDSRFVIDREIGMDSFVVCAGGLINPKERVEFADLETKKGLWIQVKYASDTTERRLNPGEKPQGGSAYLWVNFTKLDAPIPIKDAPSHIKIDAKAQGKFKNILSPAEESNKKNDGRYRHPIYDSLRLNADDYLITSSMSLKSGLVVVISSKMNNRSIVVDCSNEPLDEISSIQEALNFQSIPSIIDEHEKK